MLWEVDIYPAEGESDRAAERIAAEAHDLGLAGPISVAVAHGYLLEGPLEREQVEQAASDLLVDRVVERAVVAPVGDASLAAPPNGRPKLVYVLPKPGVMDPVAQSAQAALAELGVPAQTVRTLRKYWLSDLPEPQLEQLCSKLLANDAIEQAIVGPLPFDRLAIGGEYRFELVRVPLSALDDEGLVRLSKQGQLYLSLEARSRPTFAASSASRPTSSWKRSPRPGASIAATRHWPAAWPIAAPKASGDSKTC
jgi:phosphoribosylformylglycinamidine (FGAM) synthase PurS component